MAIREPSDCNARSPSAKDGGRPQRVEHLTQDHVRNRRCGLAYNAKESVAKKIIIMLESGSQSYVQC
jgi:hypothetical protein